jgi:hypothetical protein
MISSVATLNLQQASAFGFVERQQIGEFKKLTGEFVQNVINRQQSPNSDNIDQFRILTAQFERDVINAVINDQPSIIKVLAGKYSEESMPLSLGEPRFFDDYLQAVLRIFCETCI